MVKCFVNYFLEVMILNTLGERIAYLRNNEGISQRKLMDILGFQNLSKYEKDTREPSLEILKILSSYFNVSLHWLITGENTEIILNDEEIEIIKFYRGLTPKEQENFYDKCKPLLVDS